MDSFTSIPWQKSEAEEREYRRKKRIRLIIIGVSTFLLLVIIIASSATAIASKLDDGSNDNISSTSRDSSVKAVCGVAQYPESCVSSISAAQDANPTNDPKAIFELSLKISIEALLNLTSLSYSLSNLTEDKAIQDVLYNCGEMLEDAIDRLNDSIQLLNQPLSSSHINTLRSWLSSAITDQVTCLDDLENTTSSIRDKMGEAMVNSTQFTSNSLAIVTKVVSHLQDLDIPFHRKLLTKGVPEWVSGYRRWVILQDSERLSPNATVAKDGTGDFRTINEALALVPKRSEFVFVIYVKEGVYNEIVKVDKNKWNVVMYGDGMHKTIVSGSLN